MFLDYSNVVDVVSIKNRIWINDIAIFGFRPLFFFKIR